MKVRPQLRLIRSLYGLVPLSGLVVGVVSLDVLNPLDGITLAIVVMVATAWGCSRAISRLCSRLLIRRAGELAAASRDPERMRAVFDDIADGYRVLGLPPDLYWRLASLTVLIEEERWSEARAEVRRIDLAAIANEMDMLNYCNNLAWLLAHDGAAAQAITVVEPALAQALASDKAVLVGYLHGTLGAALTLDGRHAAALAPLRRAIELGGPAADQAIRRYYLGSALFALGNYDDAHAAWQQARSEAPATRYGRLSADRLAAASPPVYR